MDWAPRIVSTRDGRKIGYRRSGSGPPVALLHASPRSAEVLVPLAQALADRFTVFAFDNPGFGWSDPLDIPRPDAADYGLALVAAFDALGIDSAPVYGSHTGAAIAVAAAISHPDRVPALALDGYAIFTPAEQGEALASYLMPIRPEWDGSHLAAIWGRVKDQFTFFPWYLRAAAGRIQRDLPSPDVLQAVVVDFLAAGDHYRPAYAAAFRYAGAAALQALTVPTTVMARTDDLLFGHLDRLPTLPPNVSPLPLGTDRVVWAEAVATALARARPGTAPAEAPDTILRVTDGVIGVTRVAGPSGKPIVLLPAIPGSAAGSAGVARALATARPVIAIDLPGFGASSLRTANVASALMQAIQHIGVAEFDILACEESASIGCALAQGLPGARLTLLNPVPDTGREALAGAMVDVTPRIDGGHLLAAWHQLRDRALWWPWHQRDTAHALDAGTDPEVTRLQAVLRDWMRGGTAGQTTLELALSQPLATSLPPLGARAAILTRAGHPWEMPLRSLAAAAGTNFAVTTSIDDRGCADTILHLLCG